MWVFTVVGWVGALIFILAYLLLSLGILSAKKPIYHILNALGAVCLVTNATYLNDFPNILVNAVWVLIAFFAIFKLYFSKKEKN